MSEYLSKEEIKQWRSSLEKITLEEFAKRLGKTINTEKETRDIVDLVLKNEPKVIHSTVVVETDKKEKIVQIAKKSVEIQSDIKANSKDLSLLREKLVFKKPLTERENIILDAFLKNLGEIVYAKDLAKLLNLPNDYVYKYIKNLRAKISQDVLQNAAKGGYRFVIE